MIENVRMTSYDSDSSYGAFIFALVEQNKCLVEKYKFVSVCGWYLHVLVL